jgi:IS1 family transposase
MAAERFNGHMLRNFPIRELQADELFTFVGSKRSTLWLFAILEVSSRLWAGSRLGRRSYRHTKAIFQEVLLRGRQVGVPLIATDGFAYYVRVIVRLVGPACIYGQVIKTRRKNRVIRVERRLKIGTDSRLNEALLASEDSETLNTSFIERLNLTIRQGSAYLRRRSTSHARSEAPLREHVELCRCHYNFLRPHRALRFGRETRTPAMQAGLVSGPLTWSHIFKAGSLSLCLLEPLQISICVRPTEFATAELPTICRPHEQRKAA